MQRCLVLEMVVHVAIATLHLNRTRHTPVGFVLLDSLHPFTPPNQDPGPLSVATNLGYDSSFLIFYNN
jgi:hypothetical protein